MKRKKNIFNFNCLIFVSLLMTSSCSNVTLEKLSFESLDGKVKIHVKARGLKKNSQYFLCLNGKMGQNGNNALLRIRNYGGEGVWDYKNIDSRSDGTIDDTTVLELSKGNYDVTYIIKDVSNNYNPIIFRDHQLFEIK